MMPGSRLTPPHLKHVFSFVIVVLFVVNLIEWPNAAGQQWRAGGVGLQTQMESPRPLHPPGWAERHWGRPANRLRLETATKKQADEQPFHGGRDALCSMSSARRSSASPGGRSRSAPRRKLGSEGY